MTSVVVSKLVVMYLLSTLSASLWRSLFLVGLPTFSTDPSFSDFRVGSWISVRSWSSYDLSLKANSLDGFGLCLISIESKRVLVSSTTCRLWLQNNTSIGNRISLFYIHRLLRSAERFKLQSDLFNFVVLSRRSTFCSLSRYNTFQAIKPHWLLVFNTIFKGLLLKRNLRYFKCESCVLFHVFKFYRLFVS